MYQVSKAFQNTLNPTDYWNPNSRLESSTWNPEFVVWNPESKTGLDSLTSGKDMAKYSYRERSIVLVGLSHSHYLSLENARSNTAVSDSLPPNSCEVHYLTITH